MLQISRCALAFTLALISVSAASQETTNKTVQPDQTSNIGELPLIGMAPSASKGKISNIDSVATDTSTTTKGVALASKDVQQQQTATQNGKVVSAYGGAPNELQAFLQEATGKVLPIFGAEFFINTPSTFAPILNSPIPSAYLLGPGDEILIRGWGTIDINYRATIDRNGLITIPQIGTVLLGGVKAGDAESVVRGAIEKFYKGVTVNVTFGQLRAITIYVVGQASRPGTYTVSSLSTLITALFASGGPNANGSMRRVQVKRTGKVVAELDLYAFITKGDNSADIKLQDGDTIYIPSAGGYVALTGKVNSPAIYEVRTAKDTIESILDFAGGLPIIADPRRAFLERIDPKERNPRSVEQFALNAEGLKKTLKNGDLINITSITPNFSNAVVLRGNVDQPIRAPFKAGMRISDLIPNREYLITRSSIQRQNNTIGTGDGTTTGSIASRIGGLIDEINWDYAVVERVNRADLTVSLIPFNLGKVFESAANPDNVELQAGDTVTIFSQNDVAVPINKRRVFVRIEGEVNVPGVYQMAPGENLQMLLAKAGGPTQNAYLFGTAFYREQVRLEQQANLEKVIDRLESQLRLEQAKGVVDIRGQSQGEVQIAEMKHQAELLAAHETILRMRKLGATGRVSFGLDPAERSFNKLPPLKLENADRLVVPFRPEFVHIFGAVNTEASLLWRPGKVVGAYIEKAGMRQEADVDNLFIIRADGSVVSEGGRGWSFRSPLNIEVQPGDSIVIPEKNFVRESAWSKFTNGTKEWAQILANFGLGAAALKVLK